MPLTPLQESLDRTGSAFDQKLQQLVGMAQSVKASKMRKQQMVDKLSAEKDMIQFRSDVQLQQKKDYYEDVLKPQEEAERQYQQLQDFTERLNKSKEDVKNSIQKMQEKKTQAQFSSMYKYNFDAFEMTPEAVEDEEGTIVGFKPKVKYDGSEIPASEFHDVLGKVGAMANTLESIEDSKTNTVTRFDQENQILHLGNDDRGKQIIQEIKSDPEARAEYVRMFFNGNLQGSDTVPEGADSTDKGGKTRAGILDELMPALDGLYQEFEGNFNNQEFDFADADIEDDWGIGWWEDTEKRQNTIDFQNNTIGNIQRNLDRVVKSVLPEGQELSIQDLTDAEQQMIVSGEIDDETLEKISTEERAELVRRLANYNDRSRETLGKAFKYYNTYDKVFSAIRRGSGERINRDQYVLDWAEAPKNIRNEKDLLGMVKSVDEYAETRQIIEQGTKYLNDTTKATYELYNK